MLRIADNFFTGYEGSTILKPFALLVNVPLDQTNYYVCQLVAFFCALLYRHFLRPAEVPDKVRHVASLSIGLGMAYFCFGKNTAVLLIMPVVAYFILIFIPGTAGLVCAVCFTFGYLSAMHLRRQFYDYGNWSLDPTGPLMFMCMKLSMMCFNLHDGRRFAKGEVHNEYNRSIALEKVPGFLEYVSYLFSFQGILAGPMCPYVEYEAFIQGKPFVLQVRGDDQESPSVKEVNVEDVPVFSEACRKFCWSIIFALVLVVAHPYLDIPSHLREDAFFERSMVSKFVFIWLAVSVCRCRYYTAWVIGDAITNASGMGFNGFDENGTPKWNRFSNVHIWELETSLTLKGVLDSWNVNTRNWLRFVCYERLPFCKTFLTYMLSAFWHGFYPGYYITFSLGALMTATARTVRRSIRKYFLVSKEAKLFYDILTWIVTRITLCYITFPFLLLELEASHRVYKSMYYFGHVIPAMIILIFPLVFKQQISEKTAVCGNGDGKRMENRTLRNIVEKSD